VSADLAGLKLRAAGRRADGRDLSKSGRQRTSELHEKRQSRAWRKPRTGDPKRASVWLSQRSRSLCSHSTASFSIRGFPWLSLPLASQIHRSTARRLCCPSQWPQTQSPSHGFKCFCSAVPCPRDRGRQLSVAEPRCHGLSWLVPVALGAAPLSSVTAEAPVGACAVLTSARDLLGRGWGGTHPWYWQWLPGR